MEKIVIRGAKPLHGEVMISGAKNAAVGILPASLLLDGPCRIENLPDIQDVNILLDVLGKLGAVVTREDRNTVTIDPRGVHTTVAPYDLVKSMRASYYLLGALLPRFGHAEVSMPGGCNFGARPIDQHIKGFEMMGATVEVVGGVIKARAEQLTGCSVFLDVVSVGATINVMLAASRAEGLTVIENAAKEPHVVDIANFLNAMGANIKGAGTDIIKVRGVKTLPGGRTHAIIPDQIEAGTYMIAAAATRGDVVVKNIIPLHMESITAKLIEMHVGIEEGEDWVRVYAKGPLHKVSIKTMPHPGFPTDIHPPTTVLLCLAEGNSTITDSIWDTRFQYCDELIRMGAKIRVEGRLAMVEGPAKLYGTPVAAADLRAGAAMVVAGLVAEGETEISNVKFIDRGYENIEHKLRSLGADITRVPGEKSEE